MTDFGQTLEALSGGETLPGIEAVVHLAAIPSPAHATPDQVFRTNVTSTHTVFAAAARLGLRRVVWASSETTLGLPFERPPEYAPVDERPRLPGVELRAVEGARRGDGAPVQPLERDADHRPSVLEHHGPRRLRAVPTFWDDPHLRKWNLWGYVDESHVTQSVRLALEADIAGADSFIIAAADTVMKRPSRDLMAEAFPGVPVADNVDGTDTLLDIRKARSVLGYSPDFTWRQLF